MSRDVLGMLERLSHPHAHGATEAHDEVTAAPGSKKILLSDNEFDKY